MSTRSSLARSLCLASLALAGCSRSHALMPLALQRTATYVARYGFQERVEPITVARQISVADAPGYELSGPLGVSRIAWRGGVLYADQTANAWFRPAIPLLTEDDKPQKWKGEVVSMGQTREATADLTQKLDKVDIGGRMVQATLATVTVRIGPNTLVLESWYEPGTGLVQQEQRTNGNRVIQLQLVTAP